MPLKTISEFYLQEINIIFFVNSIAFIDVTFNFDALKRSIVEDLKFLFQTSRGGEVVQ